MRHTHTHTHAPLWTLSSVSLSGHSIQSACWERQMRSELWPLLMSSHLTKTHTHTHFKTMGPIWGNDIIISRGVAGVKAGWNPSHHGGDYSSEWLLHALWGIATTATTVTTDTPPQHAPPPPPQAGLIAQPITDRWMEQIMGRSISVTSYRWARCVCETAAQEKKVSGTHHWL